MEYLELKRKPGTEGNKKLAKRYASLEKLFEALKKVEIPETPIESVNRDIEQINNFTGSEKELGKLILKSETRILRMVQKEAGMVPRGHYRMQWLAIGMAVFGVPLGVGIGMALDNLAFIGIGIPMGMVIGLAVGTAMDKQAAEKGKQLDYSKET